jgi:hypothetical protein
MENFPLNFDFGESRPLNVVCLGEAAERSLKGSLEGIYERQDIPASRENVENYRVGTFDNVDNDVLAHGIAAQTCPQVVADTTGSRILSEQEKALGDGIDDSVRRRYASAFLDDAVPNCVEFLLALQPRRGAPLPRLLARKACPAAPLHVFRQLAHGFTGDLDTLAAGNRGLRDIDGGKNFAAASLPFFPQRQGLPCRIFGFVDAARLDGVADESFLVGGRTNFHQERIAIQPGESR